MYGRRRSLAMKLEVGDDGTAGPSRLGYYKPRTASPLLSYMYMQRAAPAYDACTCIGCALARGKDAHAYS